MEENKKPIGDVPTINAQAGESILDSPSTVTGETETQPTIVSNTQEPPKASPVPSWSFSKQVAADRAAVKKSGARGAVVYAVIMTAMFALCFAVLAALLLSGLASGNTDSSYPPGADAPSVEGYPNLSAVYEMAIPSVVTVSCSSPTSAGSGSGFIYSEDGYIITNNHVVEGATTIEVILYDGSYHTAKLVGADATSDIAVLKIDAKWLTAATIGDSGRLVIGQPVIAIGSPIGVEYAGTLTNGIISGLERVVEIYDDLGLLEKSMKLIQTNTILNPGNSGGPLLNLNGEVVGINTMKYVGNALSGSSFEGVGFAIPINSALVVVDEIIETGSYSGSGDVAEKGVNLGISCGTVTEGQQINIGGTAITPVASGVIVSAVNDGYPADGKLQVFDIITKIDDVTVLTVEELKAELRTHKTGDTITLSVYRSGELINVSIEL